MLSNMLRQGKMVGTKDGSGWQPEPNHLDYLGVMMAVFQPIHTLTGAADGT
jgi:hypothetical protein